MKKLSVKEVVSSQYQKIGAEVIRIARKFRINEIDLAAEMGHLTQLDKELFNIQNAPIPSKTRDSGKLDSASNNVKDNHKDSISDPVKEVEGWEKEFIKIMTYDGTTHNLSPLGVDLHTFIVKLIVQTKAQARESERERILKIVKDSAPPAYAFMFKAGGMDDYRAISDYHDKLIKLLASTEGEHEN